MNINRDIFFIAPVVVMAIGLLDMPIGYYNLVRMVVCACSLYYAYKARENNNDFLSIFMLCFQTTHGSHMELYVVIVLPQ